MTARELIDKRRGYQISKGYDAKHDDQHVDGLLGVLTIDLLLTLCGDGQYLGYGEKDFYWTGKIVNKKDRTTLETLVEAAAFLEAEIDRLLRSQKEQSNIKDARSDNSGLI